MLGRELNDIEKVNIIEEIDKGVNSKIEGRPISTII
jgi:hypothetical protein